MLCPITFLIQINQSQYINNHGYNNLFQRQKYLVSSILKSYNCTQITSDFF